MKYIYQQSGLVVSLKPPLATKPGWLPVVRIDRIENPSHWQLPSLNLLNLEHASLTTWGQTQVQETGSTTCVAIQTRSQGLAI